ncbi:MAG: hypothetical protein C4519_21410 [Desulfobacteraceae bacterium]|nr:MAG: hypothetical protein C4519_21410 [Desulfobacteraceae bacterium]
MDHVLAPPTECPACGIIYSKFGSQGRSEDVTDRPAGIKKPSPVHETSLKAARERVEMRLRKNEGAPIQAEQRSQTLQLAKQFATEAVRRRREDWQRSQPSAGGTEPEDGQDLCGAIDINKPPFAPAAQTAQVAADSVGAGQIAAADDALGATHADAPALEAPSSPATPPDRTPGPAAIALPGEAESLSIISEPPSTPRRFGSGLMRLLPTVAWIILLVGLAGAVLSWTTLAKDPGGIAGALPAGGSLTMALLLGFAYLSTGVLGFAFFWTASRIAGQLADIRRLLVDPLPLVHGPAGQSAQGRLDT